MDRILLITLSLCMTGWAAAERSYWTDEPKVLVGEDEIEEGETVKVSCTLPIDYLGGECRLYRGDSQFPFRTMTATSFVCSFHLNSRELLGNQKVGSMVRLRCDYHIQQFTSKSSESKGIVVWGSRPSPTLSVSRRFVSPEDKVEVTCSAGQDFASKCHFLRDELYISRGSCTKNLTGKDLGLWEKPTLLLPITLTCKYDPDPNLYIRSKPSNQEKLFVVDPSRVVSSVDCKVTVSEDQLEAFENKRWTAVGVNGTTVTVHITNSNLTLSETCGFAESQNRPV